jgi:hypothetical protein
VCDHEGHSRSRILAPKQEDGRGIFVLLPPASSCASHWPNSTGSQQSGSPGDAEEAEKDLRVK